MPKYNENSEIFKLRKIIANMFFEDGKALSVGDMMHYEPAKEMLLRLFELEKKDKIATKKHYLQNLRAWACKTLVAKDTSVESENTITIKKVKTQKVCKVILSANKIDNNSEFIENTHQTTETNYETSRITKIQFKSEIGRATEKLLIESITNIKKYKDIFIESFTKENEEIQKKIKNWESVVNESEKNLNILKQDIKNKLSYFTKQLNAVYENKSYDIDEKFKTAKQSYEMILKVYDNDLRQHEILIKKHESFIRNILMSQDWREKGLRQMQIYEDRVFKIQQSHAGVIANDMTLVDAGYVIKDINDQLNNSKDINETIGGILDTLAAKNIN